MLKSLWEGFIYYNSIAGWTSGPFDPQTPTAPYPGPFY